MTFKPERENGLILYNGQNRGNGNYIALSLNNGYPEFRFDSGNGPVIIRAEKPISLKEWHTVKVSKVRKEGYLLVDDQHPVAFPQLQKSNVELTENLYVGGVPNFGDVAQSAAASQEGFVGCISRLILKDHEVELKQDAIASVGITSCESCADTPCQNDGVCLETQSEQGFSCVCKSGYTGKTCNVEGISCSAGICGAGRCQNTDIGIDCYCPLNKTGDRCQYTEHLDESNLSFRDGSFAAYKTPKSAKLNIRVNVRPENDKDSVILYVAESEIASGDFAAIVIKDKHYEFRYTTGGRKLFGGFFSEKCSILIKNLLKNQAFIQWSSDPKIQLISINGRPFHSAVVMVKDSCELAMNHKSLVNRVQHNRCSWKQISSLVAMISDCCSARVLPSIVVSMVVYLAYVVTNLTVFRNNFFVFRRPKL